MMVVLHFLMGLFALVLIFGWLGVVAYWMVEAIFGWPWSKPPRPPGPPTDAYGHPFDDS
jgi:hypothetical protein